PLHLERGKRTRRSAPPIRVRFLTVWFELKKLRVFSESSTTHNKVISFRFSISISPSRVIKYFVPSKYKKSLSLVKRKRVTRIFLRIDGLTQLVISSNVAPLEPR